MATTSGDDGRQHLPNEQSSATAAIPMNARLVPVLLGMVCAILLLAALYFADAILAPAASAR